MPWLAYQLLAQAKSAPATLAHALHTMHQPQPTCIPTTLPTCIPTMLHARSHTPALGYKSWGETQERGCFLKSKKGESKLIFWWSREKKMRVREKWKKEKRERKGKRKEKRKERRCARPMLIKSIFLYILTLWFNFIFIILNHLLIYFA